MDHGPARGGPGTRRNELSDEDWRFVGPRLPEQAPARPVERPPHYRPQDVLDPQDRRTLATPARDAWPMAEFLRLLLPLAQGRHL